MLKNPKILSKNPSELQEKDVILVELIPYLNKDELFYNKETCPICGQDELIVEGRCTTCMNCGWSKCSI